MVCLMVCTVSLRALALPPAAVRKPSDDKLAETALLEGRIDDAVGRLQAIIAASPGEMPPRLLLCRAFYAEDLFEESAAACEAAAQLAPNSSEVQDWLGRADGKKADHAGPIGGFRLARSVKAAFEAAVERDPRNPNAVDDLAEYYVNAPSVVGGGLDKADALAARSLHDLPQPAHRTYALAAEARRDYGTAEREFRAAVDVAHRAGAWVDLADFYKRRNQVDKAVDTLRHALEADREHDASLVDIASILHETHREQPLAEQLLRLYLASEARSDSAPTPRVHLLLSRMLAEDGNPAGAKIELQAALALAQHYPAAVRAMREYTR
jgi:tetratricopeptide (TPR) repeat protein